MIIFWGFVVLVLILFVWGFTEGARILRHYVGKLRDKEDIVKLLNDGDYMHVLILSDNTLNFNPVDVSARAFAGFANFYLGLYSYETDERTIYLRNAIYHLRLAAALDPNFIYSKEVHYILAQAYLQLDNHYSNVAVRYLHKARDLGIQSLKIDEYLGIAYIRMGLYEQGVEHLLVASKNEQNSQFYMILGEAYAMSGNFQDARQNFLEALELSTDDNVSDRIAEKLAKVYYEMGWLEESKELYMSVLKKYPDNADAYFVLGKIYEEEGRYDQARSYWLQSLRLNPQNSEAYTRVYGR